MRVLGMGNCDGFHADEDDVRPTTIHDRWGLKIKALFGGTLDEQGRIVWREGRRPRDVRSLGTVSVELGMGCREK